MDKKKLRLFFFKWCTGDSMRQMCLSTPCPNVFKEGCVLNYIQHGAPQIDGQCSQTFNWEHLGVVYTVSYIYLGVEPQLSGGKTRQFHLVLCGAIFKFAVTCTISAKKNWSVGHIWPHDDLVHYIGSRCNIYSSPPLSEEWLKSALGSSVKGAMQKKSLHYEFRNGFLFVYVPVS